MKIYADRIPPEGLLLEDEILPSALDIDNEIVQVRIPLHVKAEVSRITNAVHVRLSVQGMVLFSCVRCLAEFQHPLSIQMTLDYTVERPRQEFDLDDSIREGVILEYPIKPLCAMKCKGLCHICGSNLNEGSCSCAITKEKTF
jgi:uncharacterized protein